MSTGDDWAGCLWIVVLAAGGWWAFSNYEIKKRVDETAPIVVPTPTVKRPVGDVYITTTTSGTVWNLEANSVRGPRFNRIGWVTEDHSDDKEKRENKTKSLYNVNCETTGYRTLTEVTYGKDGKVINSWDEKDFGKEVSYAPPGTMIASVMDAICDKRFDDPDSSLPRKPVGELTPIPEK